MSTLVLNKVPTDVLTGVAPGTPIIIGRRAVSIPHHLRSRLKAHRFRAHRIIFTQGAKKDADFLAGFFASLCLCGAKVGCCRASWVVGVAFVFEEAEGADQFGPCLRRLITSSTNPLSAAM